MTSSAAKTFMYDLVVIGGGSGGVRCARMSASHGAKVALLETSAKHGPPSYTAMGGTCVNVGCVPKKLFVIASHMRHEMDSSEGFGWSFSSPPRHDWKKLIENKNKEITRLNGAYGKILANAGKEGVHTMEGHGSLVDANTVRYVPADGSGEKLLTAKNILLAVGGWPFKPNVPGAEYAITSNEAFYLPERPQRVVVVGGGYISVEFAGIFNGLGSKVSLLHRGKAILRGFDDDLRSFLTEELKKKAIDLQLETEIVKIEKLPDGSLRVTTNHGAEIVADSVLYATGRRPKLEGLGLDKVGVKVGDKGQVVVDDWAKTSVPNIYAVGDCIDRVNLTPVALRQGHLLADALFSPNKRIPDYEYIPSTVFSQPELGTVGLTEAQAVERYQDVSVYKTEFKPMKHTMTTSKERAFMKLIVDDATDRVVGLHVVGDYSGEMVQGFAVALKAGAKKADFDNTIGIHPTSAEEFVTMRTVSHRYKQGQKL